MIRGQTFKVVDLVVVADAPPPDNPPLAIGDYCRLNSGSPLLLVTDMDGSTLTVAWHNGEAPVEHNVIRAIVRRAAKPDEDTNNET